MARKTPNSKPQLDRRAAFDSLFQVAKGERVVPGLKLIDRERIVVREQARRDFEAGPLADLSRSIRELQQRGAGIEGTGILLPLLVVAEGSGYRLVAGERRFRASAPQEASKDGDGPEGEGEGDSVEASIEKEGDQDPKSAWEGVTQLPCLVLEAEQDEIGLLQLVENMQRQDLGPIEEARAFQILMEERGLSQRDLARLLGKSRGYITNRLALLSYSPDVQEMVVLRKTTIMHAPLIQAVQDLDLRRDLIDRVVNGDISIATLQAHINEAQQQGELGPSVSRRSVPKPDVPSPNHVAPDGLAQNQSGSLPASGSKPRAEEEGERDPLERIVLATAQLEEALRRMPEWKTKRSSARVKRQMKQVAEKLKFLAQQMEAEGTEDLGRVNTNGAATPLKAVSKATLSESAS